LAAPRAAARQQVRLALREVLAAHFSCSPAEIELFSQPGQALQLGGAQHNIGLSVSHEPGMSLAAIHLNGAVGVDLMAIGSIPPTSEIHALAHDYLGLRIAQPIADLPNEQQGKAFAEAWTEFEARLKCLGENLTEWNPAKEKKLATCTKHALQTPDGYVGALACKAS
jgi:4'-phosphopantetheinyl transferase